MNQSKKVLFLRISLIFLLSVVLSACGTKKSDSGQDQKQLSNETNEEGVELGEKKIEIPYMDWSSSKASTFVIKKVLEDIGYEVEVTQATTGPMFQSVADGSTDAMTSAWLPISEKENWERFGNDLVKLNKNMEDTPTRLAVPKYMDIKSMKDLKNNKKLGKATDWTIYGIEPGTGTTEITDHAIKEYGLDNWEYNTSSEAGMLSKLKGDIKAHKPIIVTLWKPHYAFGNWDLRMLEDPHGEFGESDDIYTLARKGLEKDSPAAYKVLKQFKWNEDLMNEVLVDIDDNEMDPEKAAEKFVKNHPDNVKKWTDSIK